MAGTLNGKVVIITGAAGGFGRVLVRALLDEGAKVAALDINEIGLAGLKESLPAEAVGRLSTRVADISDREACDEAAAAAMNLFGGVHILINNGAMGMGAIRADCLERLVGIHEITPEMWQRFVATNFSGAWYLTRAVIPTMLGQRWGRIITVTTSFFTMLRGGFHPYGPTKAGLEAMAAGHAEEFEGTGVTVNVVVPGGPADTPMVPKESTFDRKDLIPPQGDGAADRVVVLRGGERHHRQPLRCHALGREQAARAGGAQGACADRVERTRAESGLAGRQAGQVKGTPSQAGRVPQGIDLRHKTVILKSLKNNRINIL